MSITHIICFDYNNFYKDKKHICSYSINKFHFIAQCTHSNPSEMKKMGERDDMRLRFRHIPVDSIHFLPLQIPTMKCDYILLHHIRLNRYKYNLKVSTIFIYKNDNRTIIL